MSKSFIPLSVPNLKGNELKYVTEAVQTEWVSTGGPYVTAFEQKIAEYTRASGAVSCQSGTAGLHVALILAGVTERDAVIVPTLTFIAAVNPVRYIGAYPVFMDCDDSLCMDPEKVRRYCEEECSFDGEILTDNATGRHVKALIVVHVFGNMADMVSLKQIAETYRLKIIEDATEALGTYYTEGEYEGSFAGTIGDLGVYSFNGNKIMTTGGGGMIVSKNEAYLARAKHLTTQAKSDELYYTHDEIGFNYRMTNLQAALGLAQLEQLETFIETKERNYESYRSRLTDLPGFRLLPFREGTRSNRWFYALYWNGDKRDRDELIRYLGEHNVQTRPIWGLIHEQRPYAGSYTYRIEKAIEYWKNVVNVPCSTNLTEDEIDEIIALLKA